MHILTSDNYSNKQLFQGRGKTLGLTYILEKRSNYLPERVLESAKAFSLLPESKQPSLMQIHKEIYAPLLKCTKLSEAKVLFPEFKDLKETILFERNTIYKKNFEKRVKDPNFVLKILQDSWANLLGKAEIAKILGLPARTSLDWILKKINFVSYTSNYKMLLNASDKEGQALISSKTKAWNKKNPEKVREHNKRAAQACKTKEYRQAQSERMFEYDKTHPERRKKISDADKKAWALCPEIREEMARFTKKQPLIVKDVLRKYTKGIKLTNEELKIRQSFYKRFWDAYPEYKQMLANAKRLVREQKST